MANSAGTPVARRTEVGAQIFVSDLSFGECCSVEIHHLVQFYALYRNYTHKTSSEKFQGTCA